VAEGGVPTVNYATTDHFKDIIECWVDYTAKWIIDLQSRYPFKQCPQYTRASSAVHTWRRVIVVCDSTAVFYNGSRTTGNGTVIRLLDGLNKVHLPMPGIEEVGLKWNCEGESLEMYGDNVHYHTDLGVAGAKYVDWVQYLQLYQARDPPPQGGTYPDDHLVLFLDNGNSYFGVHDYKPKRMEKVQGELREALTLLRKWKTCFTLDPPWLSLPYGPDQAILVRTKYSSGLTEIFFR
jgi:hypothetical protein